MKSTPIHRKSTPIHTDPHRSTRKSTPIHTMSKKPRKNSVVAALAGDHLRQDLKSRSRPVVSGSRTHPEYSAGAYIEAVVEVIAQWKAAGWTFEEVAEALSRTPSATLFAPGGGWSAKGVSTRYYRALARNSVELTTRRGPAAIAEARHGQAHKEALPGNGEPQSARSAKQRPSKDEIVNDLRRAAEGKHNSNTLLDEATRTSVPRSLV